MDNKTITRKELYDLVWSKPITHIVKDYGFSDNGFRKICKKHNIPLPKAGYWMKLKFNKKVEKVKLPKQNDNPKISLEKTNNILYKGKHPNTELALRKKEIEESKELKIAVPAKLAKPHKYITATKEYHEKLKVRNRNRDWSTHLDSSNVISINVSDKLLPRALRFMDTFIKIIEKRGYRITTENRTTILIKEQSYNIRLTEKNKRVKRETKYSWDEYDLVPTGNLSLKLDDSYPIKEWSDSQTKPLEDKLVDILAWIELRAKRDRERQIENERIRQHQEKIRIKQQEVQKLKDNEIANFEALFQSATRWHKSQYIRNYIKEFEDYAIKSNSLNEEKQQWIEWAKEKADWYDPFIEKEVKLLEDIDRDTLKPKRKSYW
ncbi:hypothetical protein OS188_07435 [Xanthomarina sp. F1114]|uniref:hypothetical protein n=1 Tax=Xanthomarina sp. F1114 TaxID=2996019 RepID=UPI00225E08B2|nr:hypothetical protein [Xanthomarina sp. F1114]MCX7547780.1 hypothetical protein [Xanthomarina sp. F1114]